MIISSYGYVFIWVYTDKAQFDIDICTYFQLIILKIFLPVFYSKGKALSPLMLVWLHYVHSIGQYVASK